MEHLLSLADRAAGHAMNTLTTGKPQWRHKLFHKWLFNYATPSQVPWELVRCRVQPGAFPRQSIHNFGPPCQSSKEWKVKSCCSFRVAQLMSQMMREFPRKPGFIYCHQKKPCYFLLCIQEALANNFLLWLGIIYYNFFKYIKNLKEHHLFHQSISRMIYKWQHIFLMIVGFKQYRIIQFNLFELCTFICIKFRILKLFIQFVSPIYIQTR